MFYVASENPPWDFQVVYFYASALRQAEEKENKSRSGDQGRGRAVVWKTEEGLRKWKLVTVKSIFRNKSKNRILIVQSLVGSGRAAERRKIKFF